MSVQVRVDAKFGVSHEKGSVHELRSVDVVMYFPCALVEDVTGRAAKLVQDDVRLRFQHVQLKKRCQPGSSLVVMYLLPVPWGSDVWGVTRVCCVVERKGENEAPFSDVSPLLVMGFLVYGSNRWVDWGNALEDFRRISPPRWLPFVEKIICGEHLAERVLYVFSDQASDGCVGDFR